MSKYLANAYLVEWDHDVNGDDKWTAMQPWLLENMSGRFKMLSMGRDAQIVGLDEDHTFRIDDIGAYGGPFKILGMFECPRDAMLFKLTWGG